MSLCVCVHSHCSEHPWRLRSEVFIPGKRSIFAHDEASEQYAADDGDGASDDDDAVDVTATNVNHEQFCESHSVQLQTTTQLVHSSATQLNVHDDIDSVSCRTHEATGDR